MGTLLSRQWSVRTQQTFIYLDRCIYSGFCRSRTSILDGSPRAAPSFRTRSRPLTPCPNSILWSQNASSSSKLHLLLLDFLSSHFLLLVSSNSQTFLHRFILFSPALGRLLSAVSSSSSCTYGSFLAFFYHIISCTASGEHQVLLRDHFYSETTMLSKIW